MNKPPILPQQPIDSSDPPPNSNLETLKWVFVGETGIRAGWSVLIYLAAVIASAVPVVLGFAFLFKGSLRQGHEIGAVPFLVSELTITVAVIAGTVVMSLIEKRKPWAYWLTDRDGLKKFAVGSFWGFIAIAALAGAMLGFKFLVWDGLATTGLTAAGFGLLWAATFLSVALFEELFFRGYLHFTLTRGLGFWGSSLITSVIFGLTHITNSGESVTGIFSVFLAGMLLCLILRVTGSLYWAIGFHAVWDWTQSFVFGVADSGMVSAGRLAQTHPVGNPLWSGGTAGPEGSLLAIPTMGLVAIGCWMYYRRK